MSSRYERWRWRTFGITWFVYASYYLTRQSFSVAKVALVDDPRVAITRLQFGWVDSIFLASYSLGQLLFGPLVDRFGPRRILLCGLLLSIVTAVANGFATTFAAFLAFGVLQGVAQSTGWTSCTKVMSQWFSLRERGRVIGWWCTHYTAGAAAASPFAGWLMDQFGHTNVAVAGLAEFLETAWSFTGVPLLAASDVSSASWLHDVARVPFWPAAFWGPAAVLSVVAVVMWFLLRDRPEDIGLPPIEQYHGEPVSLVEEGERVEDAPAGSWRLIGEVLSSPNIWMLALAYFPIKLARYSMYFWGPKYVSESLNTSAFTSALTAAWMPIGGMAGVIVAGYLSDKLFNSRRAPVIAISLLAAAGVMFLGQTKPDDLWAMRAFFFFFGMFLYGPDSLIAATAAIDFGTKRGAGAATGFVNGIGSLGGVLGGLLPSIVTTTTDWTVFFQISLVGLILSAVIVLPLWNRKPPTAGQKKY